MKMNNIKYKTIVKLVMLLMFLVLGFQQFSCKKAKTPSLTFKQTEYTIMVNDKITLDPIITNSEDEYTVNYEVVDQTVLEYKNNEFTAKSIGYTKIIVTIEEYKSINVEIEITVMAPPIKVNQIIITGTEVMNINANQILNAEILPFDTKNKIVSWFSTHPKIATVNNEGLVTAIDSGYTTIIATATDGSEIRSEFPIQVKEDDIYIEQLEILAGNNEVYIGEELKFMANILPVNATIRDVIWESSNNSIATVENGIVKGIEEGIVTIYLKSLTGIVTQKDVYIKKKLISQILLNGETNMKVGQIQNLNILILPINATNKDIEWSYSVTSETDELILLDNGRIKALKEGTVIITASALDGSNIKGQITIIITK